MTAETALFFNRLDLSIQAAINSLAELLSEHKVSVTITFEKK